MNNFNFWSVNCYTQIIWFIIYNFVFYIMYFYKIFYVFLDIVNIPK